MSVEDLLKEFKSESRRVFFTQIISYFVKKYGKNNSYEIKLSDLAKKGGILTLPREADEAMKVTFYTDKEEQSKVEKDQENYEAKHRKKNDSDDIKDFLRKLVDSL